MTDILHIGLTGGFNTGKSTLVNALLGVNILPMGSDQGTTAVPLYISKGDSYDFTICYSDGNSETYTNSRQKLTKRYLPLIYENTGWVNKGIGSLKDFWGKNVIDECFFDILNLACTIDDEKVDSIRLTCPSADLPSNVELIDLPAFDSFIYTSYRNRAIKKLSDCDVVLVVLSPKKMLNPDVFSFLKENKKLYGKYLYFVISMADTIDTQDEIELLASLKQQTIHHFNIHEAPKTTCSALLYLSDNGLLNTEIDFSQITKQRYRVLKKQFTSFKDSIFCLRQEINSIRQWGDNAYLNWEKAKKENRVLSQELSICEEKFKIQYGKLDDEYKVLTQHRTLPFTLFCEQFLPHSLENAVIPLRNSFDKTALQSRQMVIESMRKAVLQSKTKNEAQRIATSVEVLSAKKLCEEGLFLAFVKFLDNILNEYMYIKNSVVDSFVKQYGQKPIIPNLTYTNLTYRQQKIKWRFKRRKLTTVRILRVFKKLERIKQQVLDVIDENVDDSLEKALRYYSASISETCQRLDRQHQKILKAFITENALKINKRVENENMAIAQVEEKRDFAIMQHKNDLQRIKGKIDLLKAQMTEIEMNVLPNSIFGGIRGRIR